MKLFLKLFAYIIEMKNTVALFVIFFCINAKDVLGFEYKIIEFDNCTSFNPSILLISNCKLGPNKDSFDVSVNFKQPFDKTTVSLFNV